MPLAERASADEAANPGEQEAAHVTQVTARVGLGHENEYASGTERGEEMKVAEDKPDGGSRVSPSLVLDTLNFFSVLTGADLYTSHHKDAYDTWSARLGEQVLGQVTDAAAAFGSNMLGPRLALIVSAVPNFEEHAVSSLLSQPELIERHFSGTVYYEAEEWPASAELCRRLTGVAQALEASGFPEYWREERLPIIDGGIVRFRETAGSFGVWQAVHETLGWNVEDQGLDLYLCSFAAPHGMRISGNAYITDARYPVSTILRNAIHECFHPPFRPAEAEPQLRALAADPMFLRSFQAQNPEYGYRTVDGFLEENIVEAMEVVVSSGIGLLDDAVGYLIEHDEGSHTLSLVLVDWWRTHPRAEGESFVEYFQRAAGSLLVGDLRKEYDRIVSSGGR